MSCGTGRIAAGAGLWWLLRRPALTARHRLIAAGVILVGGVVGANGRRRRWIYTRRTDDAERVLQAPNDDP